MGRRFGFCSHPEAAIVKMNLLLSRSRVVAPVKAAEPEGDIECACHLASRSSQPLHWTDRSMQGPFELVHKYPLKSTRRSVRSSQSSRSGSPMPHNSAHSSLPA
jgi:hypothetical protein